LRIGNGSYIQIKDDFMEYPTKDTSLVGAAGVHSVVSELSLRGLIALPTIRNTAGVDVIVSNKAGTWQANLQIKTSRSRVSFWPVGKNYSDWVSPNNYYVFLRFNNKVERFEIFLESSSEVARNCAAEVKREKEKGLKHWAPCFFPRDGIERLKVQWEEFGRSAAN
jgi:hypothetical protein